MLEENDNDGECGDTDFLLDLEGSDTDDDLENDTGDHDDDQDEGIQMQKTWRDVISVVINSYKIVISNLKTFLM